MKAQFLAVLAALAFISVARAQEDATAAAASPTSAVSSAASLTSGPAVVFDFSNAKLSPSHWTLTLRRDGSGHFRSEMGDVIDSPGKIRTPNINRDVKLTAAFTDTVFQAAHHNSLFNKDCESHMKVAYQGDKTISYLGPDGKGTCTFNYSRDRDIQTIGDNLIAVAETIIEGVRLETLLQHDPLGLDKEMQSLVDAAQSGRAQQLCVIRPILERLAEDDHVLELVRKRAKVLLAQSES
jgi:hypothetical protein